MYLCVVIHTLFCHVNAFVLVTIQSFIKSSITFCRLLEVRSRLYELMTHCIPPDVIMRVLLIVFHYHQLLVLNYFQLLFN